MDSAKVAADETVSSLLSWGANANITDNRGNAAFIFAIQSKRDTTINLLAPLVQENLETAMEYLAQLKIEPMPSEAKRLLERAAQNKEVAVKAFEAAARFGSPLMMAMMYQFTQDKTAFEHRSQTIWMEAIKSDSKETVSALLTILPNPPMEALSLARERGVPRVARLVLPDDAKVTEEEEREALKDAVLHNTAHLLNKMPRDVEFTYNEKMDKLRPLIEESFARVDCKPNLVIYDTLIRELKKGRAHFDEKDENMDCPADCTQMRSCQRIRETLELVHLITRGLGERSKVFEGIEVSMIGSTREGSRVFYNDEVDIHLSLNHDLKQFCFFDVKNQILKRRDPNADRMNNEVTKYFDNADNNFLPKKLFYDFVYNTQSIISTLKLPDSFTMLPLTTSFNPCTRCMTLGLKGLQVMRCRHKAGCKQHNMCRCKEPTKCECLDECGCMEYASPSITWSKVGVVLHLQWREEDGGLFTIDCDLNCPTWPTYTSFDGSMDYAVAQLEEKRPVGWLEEFCKLEDMGITRFSPHLMNSKSWPVKFRLINRDNALPSQVTKIWYIVQA